MSATLTTVYMAPASPAPAGAALEIGDPLLFRRARTWWTLLALFLIAQENSLFTRQDRSYWSLNNLSRHYDSKPDLLWLTSVMWVICIALMIKGLGSTLRTMLRQKAVLAFAVLAFLSSLWSPDSLFTLRRAALLLLAFAFAWFFATYYSPEDQMRLLLAAGVIVALASVAMAILLPQYGIATTGEWKGVFGQKNHLGLGMFFLFSGLPFCSISSARRLLILSLQAILPIGLILLSQSMTSLVLAFVLIAVRVLGPYIARQRRDRLPFILFSLVCAILVVALVFTVGRSTVLPLLGRDATLTGRTDHWAVLLPYIADHLWLGYGYESFWTGTGDSLSVIRSAGGAMKGSDSGYVDMVLQFGLLGLGAMLILWLASVRDFLRIFRAQSIPLLAFWYAGVILATFVGFFTEGLFPGPGGVSTFVFVVACAGLKNLSDTSTHSASCFGR
ncbi:MAG: O-antigen ligase family protein [Terracidiphilus sp.]